jgi:hypothetical protein
MARGDDGRRLYHQEGQAQRHQGTGRFDRARAVHRGRADPRRQADQGQRRGRLHGGDPAVRHARHLDGNLAGDRRRRLHPAERPGRRDPDPPPARGRQPRRSAGFDERDHPHQRARLAIDQTVEEKDGQRVVVGKTATLELSPRQSETLALSRQLGTLSLALRSLLDASKTAEADDGPIANRDQHRALRRQQRPSRATGAC